MSSDATPTLTFYGAAGGVTGSKHLLEINGQRILFDCGTFQGLSDVRERNRSLSFAPESIDAVILSHAHLDHCGMLPLLVKRGFTGQIYSTPATKAVTARMLEDAAGIEVQDAEYRARHKIGAPDEREPLFTPEDIPAVMGHFIEVPYVSRSKAWYEINKTMRLKFYDAGHILGSAISVLEFEAGGKKHTIGYTGDVGPNHTPLLKDPEVPEEHISTLLMESTYGGRVHEPLDNAVEKLAQVVNEVCEQKGKMIVPAFALGRTQVIVYILHKLTDEGRIPRVPIFVDSPLATDITDTYDSHAYSYDEETKEDFSAHPNRPLEFRNLHYVQSVMESKKLNSMEGPMIIISASGMMTAGRVVHHLRHTIGSKRNAVFITGYQAEGTTGRRLLEGAPRIELYGDWFNVRARIELFNEFSAHADQNELVDLASKIQGLERLALVHGEVKQAERLREKLQETNDKWEVLLPNEGDILELP